MTGGEVVAFAVAAVVVVLFVRVALEDAATSRVSVSTARAATAFAIAGLGSWGLITTDWAALAQAAIATFVVTAIQLVPFLLQPSTSPVTTPTAGPADPTADRTVRDVPVPANRSEGAWIGRADVRLGVPFAWTLGWFGLGFAIIGFALALLLGLVVGAVTRQTRIPFVPFLTVGLIIGLAWALARALVGEG